MEEYYQNEDLFELQKALDRGADVNEKNENGCTILHYVVANDKIEDAVFILNHGADINIRDNIRLYPLHYACINNNLEMIELLLSHGADPYIKDEVLWDNCFDFSTEEAKQLLENYHLSGGKSTKAAD